MSASPVRRDTRGRLLPGSSLNPGGRPATLEPVRALLRPHAERFVAELVRLLDSEDDAIRLAAIKEYLDRLCGKPVQSTEASVHTLNIGRLYLEALIPTR